MRNLRTDIPLDDSDFKLSKRVCYLEKLVMKLQSENERIKQTNRKLLSQQADDAMTAVFQSSPMKSG